MYTGTLNTFLELPVTVEFESGMEIKVTFVKPIDCGDSFPAYLLTDLQYDTLIKEIKAHLKNQAEDNPVGWREKLAMRSEK